MVDRDNMQHTNAAHTVVLGNDVPRQCGITSFTSDLAGVPELGCLVVAMTDAGQRRAYQRRVCFELADDDFAFCRPIGSVP